MKIIPRGEQLSAVQSDMRALIQLNFTHKSSDEYVLWALKVVEFMDKIELGSHDISIKFCLFYYL